MVTLFSTPLRLRQTFWWAFQRAKEADGVLIMRNEDLDQGRAKPEFVSAFLEDLRCVGGSQVWGRIASVGEDLKCGGGYQVRGRISSVGRISGVCLEIRARANAFDFLPPGPRHNAAHLPSKAWFVYREELIRVSVHLFSLMTTASSVQLVWDRVVRGTGHRWPLRPLHPVRAAGTLQGRI